MVEAQHHHRATLKQKNKPFKSKHATKSFLKNAAKGRAAHQSPKASQGGTAAAAQLRSNRRNAAKQTQTKKRQALVSATRLFAGANGAPRIVAVVPLCEDVFAHEAADALASALGAEAGECPEEGLWKIKTDRFKTSLQFVTLPYGHLYAALDAAKAADYVLLLLSPVVEVSAWGDTLLRALQAQGLPSVVAAAAPSLNMDAKSRQGVLKSLLSFVQYFVPAAPRVFDLGAPADVLNALRALCEGAPADVKWRDGRAWILGENCQWEQGTLAITGVVRGAPLSADRLVHITGHGDYQVSKIVSAPLPRPMRGATAPAMDVEPALLAEPNAEDADSLVSENDPDEMENEQTWPTEEEMRGADQRGEDVPDAGPGTTPKAVRRVPKGMSEYQATWIVDDDDEDEDGEDEEDEEKAENGEMEVEEEEMVDLPEEEEVEMESRKGVAFQDLDVEEEEAQLEEWRTRAREEEDDAQFPDEIDTPRDVPARTRFARYRGLRSLRTSPWDPYENLPRDYARIFQFEDFARTERNVRRRAEQEGYGIEPGTRVTVYLKDVPKAAASPLRGVPLVLFGLLPHEHKQTVLHFAVQRNTEYAAPVRSKDALVLCVGPRRLRVRPIYSELRRGGGRGTNNVHKFERYLRGGEAHVASVFGPVVYGKVPCLLLRETDDVEAPHLVAMGTFMNPDPTRIITKRILLTGHPFKVHKKTATIRYMFFNPDDVTYFKPVQLTTKHGRAGHIREPLGTHGYFKAHFDGPLTQMDTVCMALYKRVFPRWSEPWTSHGTTSAVRVQKTGDGDAMEE